MVKLTTLIKKLTTKALSKKISYLEKERKTKRAALSKIKESIVKLIEGLLKRLKVHLRCINRCDQAQQVNSTLLGLLPADKAEEHKT